MSGFDNAKPHRPNQMSAMQISDLIKPANVYVDLAAQTKRQLLQMLCKKAGAALGLPENVVLELLLVRERLGSTGIGAGIAIPHTRLAGLQKPFGLLLRLQKPIDFESIDDKPVDIVFLLLTPDNGDDLNALACVTKRLRSPDALQSMREAPDAGQLYSAFAEMPNPRPEKQSTAG